MTNGIGNDELGLATAVESGVEELLELARRVGLDVLGEVRRRRLLLVLHLPEVDGRVEIRFRTSGADPAVGTAGAGSGGVVEPIEPPAAGVEPVRFPAAVERVLSMAGHPALVRVARYLGTHFRRRLSLSDAARHAYVSPSHLSHLLKREAGTSFLRLLTELRLDHARRLLIDRPRLTVTRVAAESGFTDLRQFQRAFKAHFGCTASELRRRAHAPPPGVG